MRYIPGHNGLLRGVMEGIIQVKKERDTREIHSQLNEYSEMKRVAKDWLNWKTFFTK